MPDATEIAALADVKTYLAITGSTKDAILTLIKSAVEDWVATYCARTFIIGSDRTEYYDGDVGSSLRLRNRPIVSITSIHADPARLFAGGSEIPSSDFILDEPNKANGIVELYSYRFLEGRKGIKAIYKSGYSTMPSDLSHAVRLIVCQQFRMLCCLIKCAFQYVRRIK